MRDPLLKRLALTAILGCGKWKLIVGLAAEPAMPQTNVFSHVYMGNGAAATTD